MIKNGIRTGRIIKQYDVKVLKGDKGRCVVADFKNDPTKGSSYLDASSKELYDIHMALRDDPSVGSDPLRAVVADDDSIFVEGIAALVHEWDEFDLVGKATTLEGVRAQCREKKPAVVMMGATFHGSGSADTIRSILADDPNIRIMVVASMGESGFVLDALRAGASGFGSRDEMTADRLRSLFWALACGDIAFSGSLGTVLQGALMNDMAGKAADSVASERFDSLDERERTVLAALEEGLSNAEISARLFLSEPTVKKCIGSIIQKLHVNNRVQAAVLSAKRGL